MKFHDITKSDMLQGSGLRVVLWVSGCEHACPNCQNPITWDIDCGVNFDKNAKQEIFDELEKDYVKGLTLSGGDPLHSQNRNTIFGLLKEVKEKYPSKDIWCYTGYKFEQVKDLELMKYVDILVDGKYVEKLSDINYHWAGSTNQRVIDVQKSLAKGKVVVYEEKDN